MERYILASVGNLDLFNQRTADLVLRSNTLTDSGIDFSITAEDIRGGMANKLIGQYFHDSTMSLTLTDALFSLEHLALNVGGTIKAGADVFATETDITVTGGKVTVAGTPKDFNGLGTIGWYTVAGKDNWNKITFNGQTADVADAEGTVVCVRYIKTDDTAREFTVSSEFIPAQCYALLTIPLFKAGNESTTSYTSSSKVGEVQVKIPNFILAGTQSLSLTASGASTTALSGNALATFEGGEGCDGTGYYAKLVEIRLDADEWDGVNSIVVEDSDVDLQTGESQTLKVYALYGGITAPRLVDNAKLTFTADESGHATVGEHTGVVQAVNEGTTIIDVTVAGKDNLIAKAVVTVE